ncbi:MAG: DUF4386 domain-containing protein [Deltaproteobacteria bacterium]|nr:DUF4386 domain-containing protein [Deltaproteobacteria bacterium]
MTERIAEPSPRLKARIAGGLYLINIVAGAFHYGFVRAAMVVPGDAGATAANILKHEMVYRLGFVAAIILLLCNVPLALIFYDLFKVVNRSLSALVVFFTLVATAIETANLLNYFAPLILLDGGRYSSALTAQQLQALAYIALALQAIGFNLAVVFFAFYDLLIGYLIFRSTFVPRTVGVLMAIGGLCYLTNSFANFLAPGFAAYLLPYILAPSGVAELSFCLWLLVLGVNISRWEEKAGAAERQAMPLKAAR